LWLSIRWANIIDALVEEERYARNGWRLRYGGKEIILPRIGISLQEEQSLAFMRCKNANVMEHQYDVHINNMQKHFPMLLLNCGIVKGRDFVLFNGNQCLEAASYATVRWLGLGIPDLTA